MTDPATKTSDRPVRVAIVGAGPASDELRARVDPAGVLQSDLQRRLALP